MKFCQGIIDTTPFPGVVLYQELGTKKQLENLVKKAGIESDDLEIEPIKGADATCFMSAGNAVIWIHAKHTRDELDLSLIHEITHAAMNLLLWSGMSFSFEATSETRNDEPLCYLMSHIFSEIRTIRRGKK